MAYTDLDNIPFAMVKREHALHGWEILTDGSPASSSSRYSGMIQLTDGATATVFNTIDGGGCTDQEFYVGFFLSGHFRDITVTGSWFMIKADPRLIDQNEPEE